MYKIFHHYSAAVKCSKQPFFSKLFYSREKFGDFDFLSSLEVLIVDQMDVFLMQNWEHMKVIRFKTHFTYFLQLTHGIFDLYVEQQTQQ